MKNKNLPAKKSSGDLELKETKSGFSLTASLPEMNEDDIKVFIKGDSLVIEGEVSDELENENGETYTYESGYESFYRSFPLNSKVDKNSLKTNYSDGVLKISLQKAA